MERMKEKFQKVSGFSKLKYSHFRELLKENSIPRELVQSNVIPEYPLILLHGYWNQPSTWKKFVTYFELNGYTKDKNLFLFDGRGDDESLANIDIRINAKKLHNLVQQVIASTGSCKVNLVAHSMGGLISRWYMEQLGGNTDVHKLIMLGTPNHGSAYLPLFTRIVGFIDDKLDAVKIRKQKFDNKIELFSKETEESVEKYIQKVAAENYFDHSGMAAFQMYPGSEFLTKLGYEGQTNYYLITGIKGLPTGIDKFLPEGPNDGAVHANSVDLTAVPKNHKVAFKFNHKQLRYEVETFNQIMNFLVL